VFGSGLRGSLKYGMARVVMPLASSATSIPSHPHQWHFSKWDGVSLSSGIARSYCPQSAQNSRSHRHSCGAAALCNSTIRETVAVLAMSASASYPIRVHSKATRRAEYSPALRTVSW
jgi:hypothetical protein